ELAFRIIDWKFAVGDGVGEGDILQAADVIEPIAKHAEQLKRYITLGNLDYYLAQNKTLDGSIWNENCPIKYGRLEYILATSEPVIHEITMTQSEQELKFKNDVVFNLHRSRKLAKIRHLNNLLLGCATGKTNGKDHLKPDYKKSGRRKTQLSLTESKPLSPIETVINKYRHFVDKNNIIEWVGNRKDRPIYLMHLDKLEMAFKQRGHDGRLIIKGRLDIGRGKGFICCLMPQHDDSTPSLHIDLVRGLWKCFGCGVYGFFAEHSTPMPLGQELKINYTRTIPVNFKRTEKLSIPEEHHKIMSLAQKILHSQFRNSPAQAYVQERCIDPELAYELGTGYGTDKIINVLLDSYSYDQLIHYGFIVISNRVTSQKGICQLLAKRGLGLQQIKREVRGNLGSTWGLPYSILHNRITFPLVLENRNTSFYGRATWPNCAEHSKHRKLTREYTGVPHGAFNAQVLRTDAPEIELSEGVFDAMSLIQLGYTPSMAMIGVDNYVILESIAGSEKDIGIAFDIDKNKYQTGQTNTAKIIERLQKMNYRGRLRNFTQDFIAANPDFLKAGKDFNEWLKYLKTA
ncbi:MAG: toprim domain-containing protein, partial [Candidatus Yanofskybacteria bacterium]|nr:toprim domain-containing protein [Candidatus Yanofskybacteria bacterium]